MNSFTFRRRFVVLSWVISVAIVFTHTASAQPYKAYSIINTFGGRGGYPGVPAQTNMPGLAMDSQGNYYYTYTDASFNFSQIIKVDGMTELPYGHCWFRYPNRRLRRTHKFGQV